MNLRAMEHCTFQRDQALLDLVRQYKGQDKTFIFVTTPYYALGQIFIMQSGVTQLMRMAFKDTTLRAYHCTEGKVYEQEEGGQIKATPIPKGYRLTCEGPVSIMCQQAWEVGQDINCSIGKLHINNKLTPWQALDLNIIFAPQFLENKLRTVFLIWDCQRHQFRELLMPL